MLVEPRPRQLGWLAHGHRHQPVQRRISSSTAAAGPRSTPKVSPSSVAPLLPPVHTEHPRRVRVVARSDVTGESSRRSMAAARRSSDRRPAQWKRRTRFIFTSLVQLRSRRRSSSACRTAWSVQVDYRDRGEGHAGPLQSAVMPWANWISERRSPHPDRAPVLPSTGPTQWPKSTKTTRSWRGCSASTPPWSVSLMDAELTGCVLSFISDSSGTSCCRKFHPAPSASS